MGTGRGQPKKRANAKVKKYKKRHQTSRRLKDIDQIQDELRHAGETGKPVAFGVDEDLPGRGQFYCAPCARHFVAADVYERHCKSRPHRRRLKDVAQEQYTQAEADLGAGRTREVLPPAQALREGDQQATAMAEA